MADTMTQLILAVDAYVKFQNNINSGKLNHISSPHVYATLSGLHDVAVHKYDMAATEFGESTAFDIVVDVDSYALANDLERTLHELRARVERDRLAAAAAAAAAEAEEEAERKQSEAEAKAWQQRQNELEAMAADARATQARLAEMYAVAVDAHLDSPTKSSGENIRTLSAALRVITSYAVQIECGHIP